MGRLFHGIPGRNSYIIPGIVKGLFRPMYAYVECTRQILLLLSGSGLSWWPLLESMANNDLLYRQQATPCPECSWEAEMKRLVPGRCLQILPQTFPGSGTLIPGEYIPLYSPARCFFCRVYGCRNLEELNII